MALWWMAIAGMMSGAQAEEVQWNALRSPRAEATSYLQTNWNRFSENYHPTYVLDEDPATAWVEGVDGNGEGQVLTLPLSHVRSARAIRVRIRNGYQKSAGLLSANAAPNAVVLRGLDGAGAVTGTLEASLEKKMGWQELVVPISGGIASLQIEVVTTHDGNRYRDTCISDVLVDIDSDETWSQPAEAARLAEAKAWIADRVAAAQFYASQPTDYPFVGFQVAQQSRDVTTAVAQQLLSPFPERLARVKAQPSWYASSQTRRIERIPEDAWMLEPITELFAPANIAWFETERAQQPAVEQRDGDWVVASETRSNDKIVWADGAHTRPEMLSFHRSTMSQGRGLYHSEYDYLLTYDQAGHLQTLYQEEAGSGDEGPSQNKSLYRFRYDTEGRINGWTLTHLYGSEDYSVAPPPGQPRPTLLQAEQWLVVVSSE